MRIVRIGVLLGVALAGSVTGGVSSPQTQSTADVVAAYLGTTTAGDATASAGLFAEDAVYEDVTFAFEIKGRRRIAAMLEGAFRALAPVERRVLRQVIQGPVAVIEWEARGRHAAEMLGVAPTRRPITVRAVSIIDVRDGLIRRVTDYTDRAGLEAQLRGK